jgi:hypothetical protein
MSQRGMEEAPGKSKESPYFTHANGMNEWLEYGPKIEFPDW